MAGAEPKPHVLYISWGFPPCRGGGVYRALATANEFAAQGCDVTVLTASRETFIHFTGIDASLEKEIDPRIKVVRIPFHWTAMETNVRKWSALRAFAPALWRRWHKYVGQIPFPEPGYGEWRKPLEEAAIQIHREHPVDLTVATANPNVDFMAADVLNKEHGVPFVMDYRDAWMLDVFDGGWLHTKGGRADRLEKSLLHRSKEAWFVNEPIRAWHAERYPQLADRMHVVANGFDPKAAPQPRLNPPPTKKPLIFGYIGTASPKVPLAEFAAGWEHARELSPDIAYAQAQLWGYLGFYSNPSPALVKLVDSYAEQGVSYQGPVQKMEIGSTYEKFDVLLLILGKGRYVTSGKVFEYTATALPIVSVHDPVNAASDVLRDYPLWFPVNDLEPDSIANAVVAAAHAARTADGATRQACADFSQRYRRELQLRPRVLTLHDQVRSRKSSETDKLDSVPVTTV